MLASRFVRVQPGNHAHIRVFTNASGSGCSDYWDNECGGVEQEIHSTQELVPVVMACTIWGRQWVQRWVLVYTDNRSVVDIMQSRFSHDPDIMHLL